MIGDNLRALREGKSLDRKDVADYLKIHESTYGKYELGRRTPSLEAVQQLADFYGVTTDQIFGNSPKNLLSENEQYIIALYAGANSQAQKTATYALEIGQIKKAMQKHGPNALCKVEKGKPVRIFVPVVGRAAAGVPIEMIEDYDDPLEIDDPKILPGDFAVIAAGDSMVDAGIHDGDRVIIRPCSMVDNGTIALIAIDNGSTIKYFYKTEIGYKLMPANSSHPPLSFAKDTDIRILGRFIRVAAQ